MGKKKVKASTTDNDADDRKRHEQPLQAVLLTEDYATSNGTTEFQPLILDKPKVLSPFLNMTLLDYSIHYLATQNVQELFVICVTEEVERYLLSDDTKQQQQYEGMKMTIIRDTTITNAGDALRELDKRNEIQSDPFILMYADTITNCNLKHVIEQHKQRHVKDSSSILTMILNPVGTTTINNQYSNIRSCNDELIIGIDREQSNRILLYENNIKKNIISVPCSFFTSHCTGLEIYTNLLDIGIYVCSPDVLARFSDEFDYRNIQNEFIVNSVAEEEEGLQNKLYAHILNDDDINNNNSSSNEYAARIYDIRTYHNIARDVLRRYVYPVVPDLLNHHQKPTYHLERHYIYKETSGKTRVGRSSTVTGPGMLGLNCFIGENCIIRSTIIGNHCHIADHCTVSNSHLWPGVQIEQNVTIQQSVIASGVLIQEGAIILKGCIIGEGCVIGKNITIPEYTRLTCAAEIKDDDFDDDWDDDDDESNEESEDDNDKKKDQDKIDGTGEQEVVSDPSVVGTDGKGRVWHPTSLDDDDDDDEDSNQENTIPKEENLHSECIGFDPSQIYKKRISNYHREDDDSFSVIEDENMINPALDEYEDGAGVDFGPDSLPAAAAAAAAAATTTGSGIVGRQEGVDVVKELKIICLEFEAATSPIENLAIELNSYKFSQNASYSDCTMAATLAILEKINITNDMSDGKLVTEFKSYLDKWGPLLQKMSIGLEEEKSIILALEKCAVGEGTSDNETTVNDTSYKEMSQVLSSGMSFRLLLQMLHDEEIVSEEAVLAWAADRKDSDGENDTPRGRLFRLQPVQDFLEWLDEESEDDDDGNDDDDDGEDD